MEIKPNVVAMEILAYLAYETVAQVRILMCHIRPYMVAFFSYQLVLPPAALLGMRNLVF